MEQNEHITNLLSLMDEISSSMLEIIYQDYFDKADSNNKYLLIMFDDAYKTVIVACHAMSIMALTQSGDMIRKLIEQAAIVTFLNDHPDKLPKFVEHYKLRKSIWYNTRREQSKIISKKLNIPDEMIRTLRYLDYGWVSDNCSETQLLREAGFNDLISWKQTFLDKFVHSSCTNTDLVGNNYDFPIIQNLVEIMCKAFDYLCCAFHNLTKFNFVINGRSAFMGEFRPLYDSYKVKH